MTKTVKDSIWIGDILESDWSSYFDTIFVECLRFYDLTRINRHFWRLLMRHKFYSLAEIELPLDKFEEKLTLYEEFVLSKRKVNWYPLKCCEFQLSAEFTGAESTDVDMEAESSGSYSESEDDDYDDDDD